MGRLEPMSESEASAWRTATEQAVRIGYLEAEVKALRDLLASIDTFCDGVNTEEGVAILVQEMIRDGLPARATDSREGT